ncbi:MFS transporter [Pseudoroseicyclus tamaricis]|uniref:MFS transporter n=1 Tax=Pseudoroseicyclus tamaricis TaxID=2705421 RepID=A0A6B2JH84_9RHOB|nr:MFS transporter [Pseudoroseicyclus tamaricis]NDV00583.1 MFS transporter [Pseudoroseicyclus tamaricis]
MPIALYALAIGAFGIGVTEFVIMGLLVEVAESLSIGIATAGTLISGYALGVVFGAPILTALAAGWSHRRLLLGLMAIFVVGNAACALAPTYSLLMAARVLTALTHGTFFGVGSVVAQGLVARERQASAIAIVFTGLTLANVFGVPFGTWFGQRTDWRMTFWAVSAIGIAAWIVMWAVLPRDGSGERSDWRADLSVLGRPPVLRGLAMTVLGYAGVFAVFTYITPLLTETAGFERAAVSPILLGFGGGLVVGNLIGGRLADRHLAPTILGSFCALMVVLVLLGVGAETPWAAAILTAGLGAAGFATVAPLQTWVMAQAGAVGQAMAGSVNIAAFNFGNAIGAWAGGSLIAAGAPYGAIPFLAALFPLAALGVGSIALHRDIPLPN